MNERMAVGRQITFFRVGDLEVSGRFYRDRLGLRLVLDQGSCRIFQAGEAAYLGICQRRGQGEGGGDSGVIFTLVVEDVDGWYRHLVGQGLRPEAEPAVNEAFGIYHFFLRDPDGYTLEFQRFLDRDWHRPVAEV